MHRGPKRNVCRYYMASGHCQYGDQCQFLHVRSGQPPEHRKPPPGEPYIIYDINHSYNVVYVQGQWDFFLWATER